MNTTQTQEIMETVKASFAPFTQVTTEIATTGHLMVTAPNVAMPLVTVKNFEFFVALDAETMTQAIAGKVDEAIEFYYTGQRFAFDAKVRTIYTEAIAKVKNAVNDIAPVDVDVEYKGDAVILVDVTEEYIMTRDGDIYTECPNTEFFSINNFFSRLSTDYEAMVDEMVTAVKEYVARQQQPVDAPEPLLMSKNAVELGDDDLPF